MKSSVNADTLKQWMDAGDVVLIDVRERDEYDSGHIDGANLLPLSCFSAADVPSAGGKKLVFQCKVGGRSAKAQALWSAEYPDQESWNFEGGILAWSEQGFAVV